VSCHAEITVYAVLWVCIYIYQLRTSNVTLYADTCLPTYLTYYQCMDAMYSTYSTYLPTYLPQVRTVMTAMLFLTIVLPKLHIMRN